MQKYFLLGTTASNQLTDIRRIKLTNQMFFLAMISSLSFGFAFLILGYQHLLYFQLGLTALYFFEQLINWRNNNQLSMCLGLLTANFAVAFMAMELGKDSGMNIFFVCYAFLPMLAFDKSKVFLRVFYCMLPIFLFYFTSLSDYKFYNTTYSPESLKLIFCFFTVPSIFSVAVSIMYFVIKGSQQVESKLMQSQNKFKQLSNTLQSIIDGANMIIFLKDVNGKFEIVNNEFKKLVNLTDEELIGKTSSELFTEEISKTVLYHEQKVLRKKKPRNYELVIPGANGPQTIYINISPLFDENKNIKHLCVIGTNITDHKIWERELIETKNIAERAEKNQERFLSNMSHEIRTPMNGILGMVNLMLDTNLTEEQEEYAEAIKTSSSRLLNIINEILDHSKIKAGKMTIEKSPFDLGKLLHDLTLPFKSKFEEKNITFKLEINSVPTVLILGDQLRLHQVLLNLIGNSIKFTHQGSVELHLLKLYESETTVYYQFSVNDTGIGIPADRRDAIFDVFTQADDTTSRKYGGTGLGLSISRQLIELMGGRLKLISEENKGSSFSFNLHFDKTSIPVKKQIKESKQNHKNELAGMRILIAEDNPINQRVAIATLEKWGIKTDIADNGKIAVEMISELDFDLVLMDIQMPEMDGLEVTKYVREVLKNKTPIIAMTASVYGEDSNKCISAGMNDMISKPFEPEELFNKIKGFKKGIKNEITEPLEPVKEKAPIEENEKPTITQVIPGMNENLMEEIVKMYNKQIPEAITELTDAVEADDTKKVQFVAHKLKSTTKLLGFNKLFSLLELIEQECKAGKPVKQLRENIEAAIMMAKQTLQPR